MRFLQNFMEYRVDLKLGTQFSMMDFFATTDPKNMRNISFDNQSVVAFKKIFMKNFGSVLIGISIVEVDAFKAIKNLKIRIFYRILLHLYEISIQERNL